MGTGSLSPRTDPLHSLEFVKRKTLKDLKELRSYPYCGHGVLVGSSKNDWQDTASVLGLFGKTVGAARSSYSAFVAKGVVQGRRPDLVGGWSALKGYRGSGVRIKGDEGILGSSDFV
ncbi:MAG: hypothetical protein JRF50_07525 [Deltaproteobacteria bacterium]|nr:hypothetical protein [Deltaproteobacteria bacterium]